jgi:hypothetical protein
VKGKVLGRKVLQQIGTLFTPDTILRRQRELIAEWEGKELRRARKTADDADWRGWPPAALRLQLFLCNRNWP